jgi:hypothetical protein
MITPSTLMMPARYISATTSMMPEPQMPVTPIFATEAAKAGIVRPQVRADHLVAGLEGVRVDPHPLDRPGGGALSRADLGALERRAGGRGGGEQAVAVAEHDLGVGADVDQQLDGVAPVRALRQGGGGGIGSHVTGDAGKGVHPGTGVGADAHLGSGCGDRPGGGQGERSRPELAGIEPVHQVVHDRVADHGDLEDVAALDAALLAQQADHLVERLLYHCGEALLATGVHHDVRDP